MDPAQIALVETSFAAVIPMADRFSSAFYERLFSLDPTVRGMFPADMDAQRQKLVDELVIIVDSLGRIGPLVARTTELGRRHAGYGVEPHHYELVLEALLAALTACAPALMTEEAVVAWRRAYHLVAETMLYGAAHEHRA